MTILLQGAGLQVTVVTPPDPIGDTLRSDAVAYWKMEEASGSSRVDATGHGYDLAEYQFGALPVAQATGKIGNAAKNTDDSSNVGYLLNSNFTVDLSAGFSFWGWIKFNQFVAGDGSSIKIIGLSSINPPNPKLKVAINTTGQNPMIIYDDGLSDAMTNPGISVDEWHFVAWWEDIGASRVYLQVDNGTIYSSGFTNGGPFVASISISILEPSFTNNSDYCILDEAGLLARPITSDECTYLYNSGAGRALFPAP